jgi:hypothetical protein
VVPSFLALRVVLRQPESVVDWLPLDLLQLQRLGLQLPESLEPRYYLEMLLKRSARVKKECTTHHITRTRL